MESASHLKLGKLRFGHLTTAEKCLISADSIVWRCTESRSGGRAMLPLQIPSRCVNSPFWNGANKFRFLDIILGFDEHNNESVRGTGQLGLEQVGACKFAPSPGNNRHLLLRNSSRSVSTPQNCADTGEESMADVAYREKIHSGRVCRDGLRWRH